MKKKAAPESPPEGPTASSVYDIFDELIPTRYTDKDDLVTGDPAVIKAEEQVEKRKEELARDPKLLTLERALEEARRVVLRRVRETAAEARKVRREYRAKGLTPAVAQQIARLVDKVNSR